MRRIAVDVPAPAKINLTLHVVGRRSDGLHLLDSLVVFAGPGDSVGLRRAGRTSLTVSGPFAPSTPSGCGNLAFAAARLAGTDVAISLRKELPTGAGMGGGSSDAAAVLRGIAALTGEPPPDPLPLGADVPVCLAAVPARMRGVGEDLGPLPPLPELPMVLVYPDAGVSTREVFAELKETDGAPMPDVIPAWDCAAAAAEWLAEQRNDLEAPAARIAPVTGQARSALADEPGCLLARMSGSGSTVFGLFATPAEADRAAARLAGARPGWWVRATVALDRAPPVQERRLTT
jgi:4-diphosphocytidyl-2-C-methyl-D-erythritol kinase